MSSEGTHITLDLRHLSECREIVSTRHHVPQGHRDGFGEYATAGRATRAEFAMLPATESEGQPLKRGRRPGLPRRRVEVNINRALNELRFRCR
jgi:hypothetical protein